MADEAPDSEPGSGETAGAADAKATDAARSPRRSASVLAGAVRYGLYGADSWALRTYALAGTLVAAFAATLVVLAVPGWAAATAGGGALERVAVGFLGLFGLVLVAGAVLPLLLVDRRRRGDRPEHQRAFGVAGWAYLLSLYLALLASAPPELRSEPAGPIAPAVEAVYALPRVSGVAFPVVAVALVLAVEFGLDRSRSRRR